MSHFRARKDDSITILKAGYGCVDLAKCVVEFDRSDRFRSPNSAPSLERTERFEDLNIWSPNNFYELFCPYLWEPQHGTLPQQTMFTPFGNKKITFAIVALQIKTCWSEIVKSRFRRLRKEALASFEAFKNITLSHNFQRVKPNYLT